MGNEHGPPRASVVPAGYAEYDSAADVSDVLTTSDTAVFQPAFRGLWIGVTGNVTITTLAGNIRTLNNVPVGILPVMGTQVRATGTTAQSINALF